MPEKGEEMETKKELEFTKNEKDNLVIAYAQLETAQLFAKHKHFEHAAAAARRAQNAFERADANMACLKFARLGNVDRYFFSAELQKGLNKIWEGIS